MSKASYVYDKERKMVNFKQIRKMDYRLSFCHVDKYNRLTRPRFFSSIILKIKTESIRKLSNQWTKTLYQNNLKYIAFFFTLFKSYRHNKLSVITPKAISYESP